MINKAAGSTNIYPVLEDAFKQLRSVNAKIKHIILLSDGYSVPVWECLPLLLTFAALLYVFDVFLKRTELFKNI
jgi:hypothetical protein